MTPAVPDQPPPFSKLPYLIAAHILILLGYCFNQGSYFHQAQLWLLFLGWLVLLLPLLKKPWLEFKFGSDPVKLLLAANLIGFILFYFFDGGIYLVSRQGNNNIILLKFVALFLFLLYFVNFNLAGNNFFSAVLLHLRRFKFYYLVILALALRLLIIFYSPAPAIDVFYSLQGAAGALGRGQNPYTQQFIDVYSPQGCLNSYGYADCHNDKFTYFPFAAIAVAPFRLLFGDVRFTYLFAVILCAGLIYFSLKKRYHDSSTMAELAVLLILYLPLSLFVLEQSWVDQLALAFIFLFVYLSINNFRYLPYLVLGLSLAIKQTVFVIPLFLLKVKGLNLKKIVVCAAAFFVLVLPFFFWNSDQFLNDAVIHHLNYKVALYSLSYNTVFLRDFFLAMPKLIYLPALIILLVFLFFRQKRDLSGAIHSITLFLLALFLLKQGFVNYYFFVLNLIILLIFLELFSSLSPEQKRINPNKDE